jgi:hypothetical protein
MSAVIDGRTWTTNNVGTASYAGGIFSVVLTSLSATGASGAFSFSLAPSNSEFGTAGSRPVTNGTFSVKF